MTKLLKFPNRSKENENSLEESDLQLLLEQLQDWHNKDEHQKIADYILSLPELPHGGWGYDLTCLLARAYNNLSQYDRAVSLLLSQEEKGMSDPMWHFRLGYAYYYMDQLEAALKEFGITLELYPDFEDAGQFILWCTEELSSQSTGHKKAEFQPELYSPEELEIVENHIQQWFGKYDHVFHEIVSPDIHVDICVLNPVPERNYYVLITTGMGAHRMNVPAELKDRKLDRAEMIICLPPDWDLHNPNEGSYWPLRWLKILARLPGEQDTWLGWGHTVPNGEPFAENTRLSGVMLLNPGAFPPEASVCRLSDGDEINFYQIIPLFDEEMEFKIKNGADALLERMDREMLEYVNIRRPNVCPPLGKKQHLISPEELKPLLTHWEGPDACIATDRIMVDGCPVGYMYRETPYENTPDSGWRFVAGDESEAYLNDRSHCDVYSLNTLCNYDSDILPLLDAPYETAYIRDENGRFRQENPFSEE